MTYHHLVNHRARPSSGYYHPLRSYLPMRTFTLLDIPSLIDALVAFIGEDRLRRCLATWRNTTELGRPAERTHRKRAAFHWWPGLESYWHSASSFPDIETILMAKDAIKVLDVVQAMPPSVQVQLASALGDVRNAPSRLFEVSMAHHFLEFGYQVEWIEESGKGIPEFVVSAGDMQFEVECKHFAVDTGRQVSRDEFAKFSATVQAQLRKRRLQGSVNITLEARLPRTTPEVDRIASIIGSAECAGGGTVVVDLAPWGKAELRLAPVDDVAVNWSHVAASMRDSLPLQGHALAHGEARDGYPTNPLVIMLRSEESDAYLRAVYQTMKEAAKRQLSGDRPALLCIHLPEIRDFASLLDESGLRAMTAYFFSKPEHSHVFAVSYSSDTKTIDEPTGFRFTEDALAYRNANCRYPEALRYQLFEQEVTSEPLPTAAVEALRILDENL